MQTFLPYADFIESAKVLDNRRLGKQRVEAYQLLLGSWPNHPASKMWSNHRYQLKRYGLIICREWRGRGFKDTVESKIAEIITTGTFDYPPWFGREDFHAAHRSNLLRKNRLHYSRFGWSESDDLPYVWS